MNNNYFPHDSNSRNSDKLLPVRMKYGAEGYGIYFMILERLRDEKNYTSVKDYNMLAFDLRVDTSILKAVVEDFGLFAFTENGECFYSEGFNKRMEIKDNKSKKRSEAGKKGADKRWGKQNDSNAIAKPPKKIASKVKESKEEESKENNNKIDPYSYFEQQGFGSPYGNTIGDDLAMWIDDFVKAGTEEEEAEQIIIHALNIAIGENIRKWSYVKGILRNWFNKSLYTLNGIEGEQNKQQGGQANESSSDWDEKL